MRRDGRQLQPLGHSNLSLYPAQPAARGQHGHTTLPTETFQITKSLSTLSLAKPIKNAGTIFFNLRSVYYVFAKFQKATIRFPMCVCPSVHRSARNRPGSTGRISTILYFRIFRISVDEINASLKFDKNNGYFTSSSMYIMAVSR